MALEENRVLRLERKKEMMNAVRIAYHAKDKDFKQIMRRKS